MTWNGKSLSAELTLAEHAEWRRRTGPSARLLDDGPASNWRPATIDLVFENYRSFLGWLASSGSFCATDGAEHRIISKNVVGYIAAMRARKNCDATISLRIVSLDRVLAVMAPTIDRKWLRSIINKLPSRGDFSRKRARLQETAVLVDLGMDLMRSATNSGRLTAQKATIYRDGLQIALLAFRPLRRGNLVDLELGVSLVRRGSQWQIYFEEDDTKSAAIDCNVPEVLVPFLERYLDVYRPLLCGNRYSGPKLWVSYRSGPQAYDTVHDRIVKRTKEAFGVAVNPHLFRDSLATSLAINDPEIVGIGHLMLGNTWQTCQRYYNLARTHEAGRSLAETIAKRRKRGNKQ